MFVEINILFWFVIVLSHNNRYELETNFCFSFYFIFQSLKFFFRTFFSFTKLAQKWIKPFGKYLFRNRPRQNKITQRVCVIAKTVDGVTMRVRCNVYTPNDGLLALLLFIQLRIWFWTKKNFPRSFSFIKWSVVVPLDFAVVCGACAVCVSLRFYVLCYVSDVCVCMV